MEVTQILLWLEEIVSDGSPLMKHTLIQAGAAELAMLLRRVLLAFKVDAQDIRFATSSATFGNGEDKEKDERELKEFIAGITGINADQVEAVGGSRIGETEIPQGEDEERWKKYSIQITSHWMNCIRWKLL